MKSQNAMQRELAKLEEQWQAFLGSDKAILHWKVKAIDQQLANTFIKLKEQFSEEDPQFLVQLSVPFSGAQTFGWELAKELNRLMFEAKSAVDEEGPQEDWRAPDLGQLRSGFHALFASCHAILDAFGDVLDNLVLAIVPPQVTTVEAYRQWWEWACKVKTQYADEWPDSLRFIVFDSTEQPFLQQTLQSHPQVMSLSATANMQAAVRDLAQAADDGTDGAKVRVHLVAMNEAIADSDLGKLEDAAGQALPIAERNQWWDVWATLLMTRAGGCLNMQHFDKSLKDYRQAQQVASQGMGHQVPGCDKLLLQSMLCEGTSLFLADELEAATKAYSRTGEKAEELDDLWLAMEGWRMASFCAERLGEEKPAWQLASKAFALAKRMTPEQLEQSTVPFVGQALLRLSPNQQVKAEVQEVFAEWLGEDWLQNLEKATA